MVSATLFAATPAVAATVYEITARWADDAPEVVASGDVVGAEWRINVNDDAEAPSNEPVDNVTFTTTVANGRIASIPDLCLITGVDPVSSISADGLTLTCNVGTQVQGTAAVVIVPVRVDGPTDESISMSGQINGQTATVPDIPIQNPFGMDMRWGTPNNAVTVAASYVDMPLQWTLSTKFGSDPGPSSVSYNLTFSAANGSATNVAPVGCAGFNGTGAPGHPWSAGAHNADQTAPFVQSCTLIKTGANTYRLTLTGIDYSRVQVPTRDSLGSPLPSDQQVVASGQITFRVSTVTSTGTTLTSNAPTYTAPTGQTAVDDASNNTSTKVITFGGTFATIWNRTELYMNVGGSNWDDSIRVSPGATLYQQANGSIAASATGTTTAACSVIDTRYVEYVRQFNANGWNVGLTGAVREWYVGNNAAVNPAAGNAAYNPGNFNCGIADGGWTTTEPADKSTIKAMRITLPTPQNQGLNYGIFMEAVLKDDVAAGTDVWEFGNNANNGVWSTAMASGAGPRQNTPNARYPWTTTYRDILRVVVATPAVQKSVDRSVVRPGVPATYTLTYSANGAGQISPTVDDFVLVDTLPAGMSYVGGSASPEPQLSTNAQGRQVLTWTFDGVTTNAPHVQTYQSVADATVVPGQILQNSVTATLGIVTTADTAQVTVSTSGTTTIAKTTDQWFIANPDGSGDGEGSWTITLRSQDPLPQAFTDTIDLLPFNGDGRGTSFSGSYDVTGVDAPAGATVYYTTADPATLSDDPADPSNGAAGAVAGNTVGWSTTPVANPTAIRVIGGALAPGAISAFTVNIATDGAAPGDVWMNRAQARAEHTELVMRTSEPLTMGTMYSVSLKKYVQDADGVWRDANDVADYPTFRDGDTIKYRVVVTNTGQGTLTDLVVADDQQPELGSFEIGTLEPGEANAYVHEYEITLGEGGPDSIVNTACVNAPQPDDTEEPVQQSCDPAGFEVDGEPTHVKSLISATPIGGGQWQLVYGIDVTNTSTAPTSYSLDDTLHFTEHATITSATVTAAPAGVTLADPAWNGQDEIRIASDVPLAGTDDAGYAPHHYEVTVVADVPLQIPGAGSGADDPTQCGPDGDAADRAFNNTSTLTDSAGDTEDDQACAEIPSIDITKGVSAGPTPNGDGTWTVTYDIVATNTGSFEGVYEVTDRMTANGDMTVVSGAVTSTPDGVTASPTWTGLGAEGAPENVIATGIMLPAGGTHTYQVEVIVGIDPASGGSPVITDCSVDGTGGLTNAAGIEHNDLNDDAEACITIAFITIDKTISEGPTPNGDGTYTITYDLVAENIGAAAGDYDLSDQLRYGDGIDIVTAEVITTPDGVTAEADWTGLGADLDSPENLIAGDITLAAAGTHTYQVQVVVELDEATIDPADLACPAPGSGENGGLANSTSLTHNGIPALDEVCASLPLIEIDKSISAGPTENGDGTWTITYDLVATNTGEAAGDYDVADQLKYGAGIVIDSAAVTTAPAGVAPNTSWTGQGPALDSAENVIATDVTLEADGTHTYQVQVVVSLDQETVTPDTLACPEPGSGENGGLANTTELTHNGETQDDDVCATLPLIKIVKSISGAVTPVDGQPGQYDVTYELTVTNSGPGAGSYNLDDRLQPGDGIDVIGIQQVTTNAPDQVGLNPAYDGLGDIRIVTGQPITGAAPATPVVHTYTVTVRYAADLAGIEIPVGDQCTDESGPVNGALNNTATVDWNGIDDSDVECIRPGKPTLDKALVSATPIGGGQWTVVYDLTVGNVGNESTRYDLDDDFLFAPVVTVDTVEVTGPDGVAIEPDFDGDQNKRIATDVAIAGLDDDGYAPHVYRVTVTVDVPLTFEEPADDGTGAPGCTIPAGENTLEQGLNNAATLTDESGNEQTDTDCAQLPAFDIAKQITGNPTVRGDRVTTSYEIVVTNTGAATGAYVLRDQLRYGAGLTVQTVTATNTAPGGIPVLAGYTGQAGELTDAANQVTDAVELTAGGSHTYQVVVTATITDAATPTSASCADGSDAGGVRNVAAVDHNGLSDDATACAPFEIPGKPADLASTGVTIMASVAGGVLLLLFGGALLIAQRRRTMAE